MQDGLIRPSYISMPGLFENTVSALCYEIARPLSGEAGAPYHDDVTEFVLGQWRRMPLFWAWPLRLATLAFALLGFLGGGSLFHRLPPLRRQRAMESWRNSSIGPCRDLMRFYRSLSLVAFYSRGPSQ